MITKQYKDKICVRCGLVFIPTTAPQKSCSECKSRNVFTCIGCGKQEPCKLSTKGRYCSRQCFINTTALPETRIRDCPVCLQSFKPAKARQKTCSVKCGTNYQRRRTQACPVCGIEYSSKHRSKTCSQQCAGVLRRLEHATICERCGKSLPWSRYRFTRFCSQECRATPIGTVRITNTGYAEIKIEDGWMMHHRYVMEQILGRTLERRERVHHRNSNRSDNRPENLELWTLEHKDPPGARVVDFVSSWLFADDEVAALSLDVLSTLRGAFARLTKKEII